MFPAHRRLGKLATYSGNQAAEVVFEQVIRRPGLHRLGHDLLADGAGHQDGGQVLSKLADQLQRGRAGESRQPIVDDSYLPVLPQRVPELGLGLHAAAQRRKAAALQFAQHEKGVVDRVLHEKHPQPLALPDLVGHGPNPFAPTYRTAAYPARLISSTDAPYRQAGRPRAA